MTVPQKLPAAVERFIEEHAHADTATVALRYREIAGVPIATVVDQLVGRRKARAKLPEYHAQPDILYPPSINIEQCSSEATAKYKAALLSAVCTTHESIADLTGGFGVDTFYFSRHFDAVVHVEPDADLQQLSRYDHVLLGARNITYVNMDAATFLESMTSDASALYVDPSRRKASKKVFSFHDCSPDVVALQPAMFARTRILLIKASPLHDIQLAIREVQNVSRVIVLAVDNECRELLLLAERGFSGEATISAVNITDRDTVVFDFQLSAEQASAAPYGDVSTYIYEPSAAVLKAGAFKLVAARYGVRKLHPNTHLYTSDELAAGFPGKIFRLIATVKANAQDMRLHFPDGKANLSLRNYPATPEALKRTLRLSDGGERYLLGFTTRRGKMLVAAERVPT